MTTDLYASDLGLDLPDPKPVQETSKPKHSHFTEDALKLRVCPACGVVMPTSKERAA
jgi:hypothetical protein